MHAGGRSRRKSGLTNVGEADANAFDIAEAAAGTDRPGLAESDVHAQAKREVHIIIATAEGWHDDRVGIRGERCLRSLQLEPPPEGNTYWKKEQIRTITQIGAESYGEGAIEREALAVAHDSRAEISTDQEAGVETTGTIRESGLNAEVVGSAPVAVEALEGKVGGISGIRQRSSKLIVGEGAVRCFEDRRAGLLSC